MSEKGKRFFSKRVFFLKKCMQMSARIDERGEPMAKESDCV